MIDAAALLSVLQTELKRLVADLDIRVGDDAEVRQRLHDEWHDAFAVGRTGRTFEVWRQDRLTQVGVGWLLAPVFVRFGEDNRLISEAMIAGPGERGGAARAAQQRYFAEHPHHSDREYLQQVFRDAATLPGLSGLLKDGESPLWLLDPPADACTRLIGLFRSTDGDSGALIYDFTDPGLDTRFLGDLYQDLSEQARSDYALLQTPMFVEEFILDRTLEPAIETFGLARTTLIDPTCGSGHFLLGAFERLWRAWRTAEPATSGRELAQRALSAVTGVDLNPFAAAIARFRLLVAALKVCAITDLRDAPDFVIDVAVGDSLLWGARPGQFPGMEAASTADARAFLYRTEHASALQRVFAKKYTAVVGNPPYIIARDKALNTQYRARYPKSCSGKYSLAAPFLECFFDLAQLPDGLGRAAGYVGMITANSFMKREFGKKLIEQCIPTWDLTHVVDTSGAYIPGHGTPTVIMFGRHQSPVAPAIRTVMGIRGEPSAPADPGKGIVWTAIVDQIDHPGSESGFISVSDTDRTRFATHPWSIGGGGAAELKEALDQSGEVLTSAIAGIGVVAVLGDDEVLSRPDARTLSRQSVTARHTRGLVLGDRLRDWTIDQREVALFPYTGSGEPEPATDVERLTWPQRAFLRGSIFFGKVRSERGLRDVDFAAFMTVKLRTPLSIAFAFVATHNHFVLDRGGKVFNRSAPVIKLPAGATVDDHLALVGLLNSSIACFWMKQVFQRKTQMGGGGGSATVPFTHQYEHDGTKLKQFPLPPGERPVALARHLDAQASELAANQPATICGSGTPTGEQLDDAHGESERIFAEMVAWQEELDWTCLHLYGLTDDLVTVPDGATPPPLALGERAFEIVLARKVAAGEAETAWFTRHGSIPITELPAHWTDWYRDLVGQRIDLIERDRDVALVERPEHKRRWAREPWDKLEREALQSWLADRLEDRNLWFEGRGADERAVCRSIAQLADRFATDDEFMGVVRLWSGRVEVDLVAALTDLVADEHVPVQAAARYKPSGMVKRAQWERTWDLQRMEDRGESLPGGLQRIPVPPKYAQADFITTSYWRQRGKLDVPKERFTSVTGASRESDPTLVLAWAGFDHAQLAQAVGTLIVERQHRDGWSADRAWPLVVGLVELLPWLEQWHNDIDPRWGASPAQLYRGMAEQQALAGGRTIADATDWRPAAPKRGRRATSAKRAVTEELL